MASIRAHATYEYGNGSYRRRTITSICLFGCAAVLMLRPAFDGAGQVHGSVWLAIPFFGYLFYSVLCRYAYQVEMIEDDLVIRAPLRTTRVTLESLTALIDDRKSVSICCSNEKRYAVIPSAAWYEMVDLILWMRPGLNVPEQPRFRSNNGRFERLR